MRHATIAMAAATAIAVTIAGCASQAGPASHARSSPAGPSTQAAGPTSPAASGSARQGTGTARTCRASEPHPRRYYGIIDGYPGGPVYSKFVKMAKIRPTLVDYFMNFGTAWNPGAACSAVRQGAMPLIQFNLRHLSVAQIADGGSDRYISHLADQVRAFGLPIVISIGHEMNGSWYPWGWHHTPAPAFVRMWRRVHDIFGRRKAANVIWMWTINRAVRPATSPRPWWPGRAYVNWVGIDGHDRHPTDNFRKVFGSTIAAVRAFTSDPILISETAVVAGPRRPAQIAELFRTVYRTPGLIGLIYLNTRTARIDWRLDDAASIRAFVKAAHWYESAAAGGGRGASRRSVRA